MIKSVATECFWCKKELNQRIDTYKRQSTNYGHACCKNCFGKEQSFKDARKRVMTYKNPFAGKTHTEKTRKIISEKTIGRPAWNKGIRTRKRAIIPGSINKWMEFKKTIIERDVGTCWKCNTNKRIEVHHIVSKTRYPEHKYDQNACITLCYWCHKDFHKKYTIRSFKLNDTINWLNEGRQEEDFVFFC